MTAPRAVPAYNRALDRLMLAAKLLHVDKNPVLAARMLAFAVREPDIEAAIMTIEATNRYAHKVAAAAKIEAAKKEGQSPAPKQRLKAEAEFPAEEDNTEFPIENQEETVEADFDSDPLDEVQEDEEEVAPAPVSAGKQMANVLSTLVRKTTK